MGFYKLAFSFREFKYNENVIFLIDFIPEYIVKHENEDF